MMFSLGQEGSGKGFVYGKDLRWTSVNQNLQTVLHRDGCGKASILVCGGGAGQDGERMPDACAAVSAVIRKSDRREAFFIQQVLVIEMPLDVRYFILPF